VEREARLTFVYQLCLRKPYKYDYNLLSSVHVSLRERDPKLKMVRSPCCSKVGMNRGAWSAEEDKILTDYIETHGEGKWRNVPREAGKTKDHNKNEMCFPLVILYL
jgi:hypothetical protein